MRRQVGFIKTYHSSQHNPILQQEPSQFSYFRMGHRPDSEEFSPYKFQEQDEPQVDQILTKTKKSPPRPPLPQRPLQKAQTVSNLADRVKADHLHTRLQQKVAAYNNPQPQKSQALQENIGNIRNKIEQLDVVLKQLKTRKEPECQQRARSYEKMKKKFEEDEWSETSSDSEREVRVKAIPKQKIQRNQSEQEQEYEEKQQQIVREHRYEGQQQEDEDELQEQQQFSGKFSSTNRQRSPPVRETNVITFNSRLKDQPPLQIKSYSSSDSKSSSESQQHLEHIPERDPPVRQKLTSQFHKNRGGVCFQVDVKQFKAASPPPRQEKIVPRKKKPVDKRAQILRRRQAAKAYDKMARRAVFSPHY